MEGPSLVIATEEFKPFIGSRSKTDDRVKGQQFLRARSWGKHFILEFEKTILRIHFLMFGSYRIDNPRENRVPKMVLTFPQGTVNFYSCAIKEIDEVDYDWTVDTMSSKWSTPKAVKTVRKLGDSMICDVLMDQNIFAGVGNIIKNEVFFRQKLHPETRVAQLTPKQLQALVADTRAYCLQFYKWKKANVLKRNWQIMRKRKCPLCGGPITKKPTGKLQRLSHWCKVHQPKPGTFLAEKSGGLKKSSARKKKVAKKLTTAVKR